MRHYGDRSLLFACNFSATPASIDVHLPPEVFTFMGFPETEALNSVRPVRVQVPAFDATIVKFQIPTT